MITEKLRAAIRQYPGRQWQLAHSAGLHPTVLAKIVSGAERPRRGDVRVIALGAVLGIEADACFELESASPASSAA